MKLSAVLASIKGEQEKTAEVQSQPGAPKSSEKTAGASSSTAEKLKAALKDAAAPAPAAAEKTASASSPVEGLTRIAASVAGAEQEALVKEAQLYGAAVCDGFMARLSQYNDAAEKIAAQQSPTATRPTEKTSAASDSFEKFAQENPNLVREAAELGYATTMNQIEKLAEAAWQKGYNEGTATIYKLAHSSFVQGYQDTGQLLQELR